MTERENRGTAEETLSPQHYERAIGASIALFTFFVALKVTLFLWQVLAQHVRPLADAPPDAPLYLFGPDLFICLLVACASLGLWRLGARTGKAGFIAARVLRGLMYAGVVIFCVASFQVVRIYGEPLDVELLRSGDNLLVLRESIWAYVGPMVIILGAYGLVCIPLLSGPIARFLHRRTYLRRPTQLWLLGTFVCTAIAVGAWVRLHGIYTYGVKDNAIVFFLKEYRAPFRPIDSPRIMNAMEVRRGASLHREKPPASQITPGGTLQRDFAKPAGDASGFNLILIQMESTSALHVDSQTAPNIMALAQHGLSLKRHATAATQTQRATCGIYYSDYLPDMGTDVQILYRRPMPQPALAQVLHDAGYRTAVFQTGFLDYLGIRFIFQGKGMEKLVGAREMVNAGAPLAYSSCVREESTVAELSNWIRQHKNEKFFAAYLTECPHHPYMSMAEKNPFPSDTWLNRYKNSLHYADENVGKLIEFLKTEGLIDKTLIVVVGDHGETVSTYPVGHGLRVSAEEIRTPCVFSNPQLFPAGAECHLSTNHLDISPTIVGLLGLKAPPEWLGRDLMTDHWPATLGFTAITHIKRTCVVDNGLMYAMDDATRIGHLYELSETELKPLPDDDPRQKLCDSYREQVAWFLDWSAWRHLKRAAGPAADLAREPSPPPNSTASPRTASHALEPVAVPGS